MKHWIIVAPVAACLAPAAQAQDVAITPLIDTRLRFEHATHDGQPDPADALTLRVRAGLEAKRGDLSIIAETDATVAIIDRYNNFGLKAPTRPTVVDGEGVDLNRLQLQYRGLARTVVTAGRQRIAIDDERFIGPSLWRQNDQVFDALRIEARPIAGVAIDATYAWNIRTIFGEDPPPTNPAGLPGEYYFARAGVETPVGTLSGIAILVAPDSDLFFGGLGRTQTYGGSLAGAKPLGKVTANYRLTYAHQREWKDNPVPREAAYYLAEGKLSWDGWQGVAGYEIRGAGSGGPLTSYQAFFSSAHNFVGFADILIPTPKQGARQLYGEVARQWKAVGPIDRIDARAIYHRFANDIDGAHYGDEIDLIAVATIGRYAVLAKYADFRASAPPPRVLTDTRKIWLSIEWRY
jgi:hypothetical protein